MRITGTGVGGSGGVEEGRVAQVVLEGVGHLVAMECVDGTAEAVVDWLGKEIERVNRKTAVYEKEWVNGVGERDKVVVDEEWKRNIKVDAEIARRSKI